MIWICSLCCLSLVIDWKIYFEISQQRHVFKSKITLYKDIAHLLRLVNSSMFYKVYAIFNHILLRCLKKERMLMKKIVFKWCFHVKQHTYVFFYVPLHFTDPKTATLQGKRKFINVMIKNSKIFSSYKAIRSNIKQHVLVFRQARV